MKVPIIVRDNQYLQATVFSWKSIWSIICDMCYNGTNIQEEIIVEPGSIQIDEELVLNPDEAEHCKFYRMKYCVNEEDIILDTVWKDYSKKAGATAVLRVVPEFKKLHVPAYLYYTLGVDSWFAECFPNCEVTFWET